MSAPHMRFNDYFAISARNIRRQKLRNSLAVLAVVIGVASVIAMLGFVFGARNFYLNQFESTGKLEQIVVSRQGGLDFQTAQQTINCDNCPKLTDELQNDIASLPNVIAISPTVRINAFETISLGGQSQLVKNMASYQVNGVIQHIFLAGKEFSPNEGSGKIIVGQSYADKWGYKDRYSELVGQQVTLTTNSFYTGEGAELQDPQAQFKQCKANGCRPEDFTEQLRSTSMTAIVAGVESDDPDTIFVPMKWATVLLQNRRYEITEADQIAYTKAYMAWGADDYRGPEPLPTFTLVSDNQIDKNGYSNFIVKIDDSINADSVTQQIRDFGVGAVSGLSYVEEQLSIFNIISYILSGIGSVALIVAAIGIVNTMVMTILERTREIGIMRAVGAKRYMISRMFVIEAALLGLIGGIIGVLVGYGVMGIANYFVNGRLLEVGISARNIISLPIWLVASVILAATFLGIFAGLYPAHRAAKMDPVEALRRD